MNTQENINYYEKIINEKNKQILILEQKIYELEAEELALKDKYESKCRDVENVINSRSWKLTSPYRTIKGLSISISNQCKKGIAYLKKYHLKEYHLKAALRKIESIYFPANSYADVKNRFIFSEKELKAQTKKTFPQNYTISILVPVYNTDKRFLNEMIKSVMNQTYGKWELCLADASDKEHDYVENICQKYAQHDSRIKYKKLKNNHGISANTNECLKMCTGEYIALLDHDDMLHPAALHEVMNAICNENADFIYTDETTFNENPEKVISVHFKPDFAPDTLISNNYICHFSVFSRKIYETVGEFNSECDGSQDHDYFLRATSAAKCIAHIPEVLYFWRAHENSTASVVGQKPYAQIAGQKAVKSHIIREGKDGTVTSTDVCSAIYRVSYELKANPKISIIIISNENLTDLRRCIVSIINKTSYDNYEIVIVGNNSASKEVLDYYEELKKLYNSIKIIVKDGTLSNSAMNNFGAENSSGEVLLFLNNHTMIKSQQWIEEMLMYAQREDVGAVGAKLCCPDNKLQHAGIFLRSGDFAGRYYYRHNCDDSGYMGRKWYVQDLTAVAGDCLMIQRNAFNKAGGFDEKLSDAFNDVDLCLKLRKLGYLNVWTPFSELYYFEPLSRTDEYPDNRFKRELDIMSSRWSKELALGDPYYNPNFDQQKDYFCCKYESNAYKPRCYKKHEDKNYEYI